jgi:hypothetical protein
VAVAEPAATIAIREIRGLGLVLAIIRKSGNLKFENLSSHCTVEKPQHLCSYSSLWLVACEIFHTPTFLRHRYRPCQSEYLLSQRENPYDATTPLPVAQSEKPRMQDAKRNGFPIHLPLFPAAAPAPAVQYCTVHAGQKFKFRVLMPSNPAAESAVNSRSLCIYPRPTLLRCSQLEPFFPHNQTLFIR